eukprot:3313919-Rhodomonas_salina.2
MTVTVTNQTPSGLRLFADGDGAPWHCEPQSQSRDGQTRLCHGSQSHVSVRRRSVPLTRTVYY